ncbi:MAG: hypothetical protein KGP14_17030, partial [Betaproteobacteria bacterium]|nr:hypothetical protein [Betaproteobacteria bacterium]
MDFSLGARPLRVTCNAIVLVDCLPDDCTQPLSGRSKIEVKKKGAAKPRPRPSLPLPEDRSAAPAKI